MGAWRPRPSRATSSSTGSKSTGASSPPTLPHARLAVRGRGRGAGDVHPRVARRRPLRGPRGAPLVALPDRDERLPRHARRPRAARAADGSRPVARARPREREHPARGDVDRADARTASSPPTATPPRSRPDARRSGSRSSRRCSICPPRQRAVLILCEVLRWKASEVAELLETSTASVNSALQRARATLEASNLDVAETPAKVGPANEELLARYVAAFEAYDMDALTALIHEDATQSMPPYDLWLTGRDDIFEWWFGPGIGCKGSKVHPDAGRERLAGVRAVQAGRGRRRLRAVGRPGSRGRGREDQGVHVLPLDATRCSRSSDLPPRLPAAA